MAKIYYKGDPNQSMDVPDFDVSYWKGQGWTTSPSSNNSSSSSSSNSNSNTNPQPQTPTWYLSSWSGQNGTWNKQPVLTINGQQFRFNTPQEYIDKMQSSGLTGSNVSTFINQFQNIAPQWNNATTNTSTDTNSLTLNNLLNDNRVKNDQGVNGTTMTKWLQGNASLIPQLANRGYSIEDLINEAYSQVHNNTSAFAKDMTTTNRSSNTASTTDNTNTDPNTDTTTNPTDNTTTDKKIYKQGNDLYTKQGDKYYRIPDPATLYDLVTNKGYQDVREDLPSGAVTGDFGDAEPTSDSSLSALLQGMIDLDPFLSEQLSDPTKRSQFDSLDDSLKMQYLMNMRALNESIQAGKIVNPNLEITPEQAQVFEDQARERVSGYYDELIGFETGDLKTSLERMKEDFVTGVSRAGEAFTDRLNTQSESEAQSGLAFGSERGKRESKTIKAQQQGLDDASLSMARSQQDLATQTERRIGSDAFGGLGLDFTTPNYSASRSGISNAGSRSLFTPAGNLVGELPKQREVDVINEKNNLITAEKQKRILDASTLSGNAIPDYSGLIETPRATVPTASASTITLPNGQRISNLDPNYAEYKRQYNL